MYKYWEVFSFASSSLTTVISLLTQVPALPIPLNYLFINDMDAFATLNTGAFEQAKVANKVSTAAAKEGGERVLVDAEADIQQPGMLACTIC